MTHEPSAATYRHGVVSEVMSLLRPMAVVASRPANLLAALVILVGWSALLSWTGNGPGGWQARTCAGSGPPSRACAEATPAKDLSRVVPHTAGQAS